MQEKQESHLLQRLKLKEDAAYKLLYNFYFPAIAAYVRKNHGNGEDAKDIFQESIIVLLQKLDEPGFRLTSSLKTYLYAIARNLWLKRLRDSKLLLLDDTFRAGDREDEEALAFTIADEPTMEEKLHLLMLKIPNHCRFILHAIFFAKETMDSLMARMGWKNRHTADNQKYKCIQQAKKAGKTVNSEQGIVNREQ